VIEIPAADVAASNGELDQAHGALGTFVADRVLAAEGRSVSSTS
jgi:hypothetical protein